jgi:hypothetical protein
MSSSGASDTAKTRTWITIRIPDWLFAILLSITVLAFLGVAINASTAYWRRAEPTTSRSTIYMVTPGQEPKGPLDLPTQQKMLLQVVGTFNYAGPERRTVIVPAVCSSEAVQIVSGHIRRMGWTVEKCSSDAGSTCLILERRR